MRVHHFVSLPGDAGVGRALDGAQQSARHAVLGQTFRSSTQGDYEAALRAADLLDSSPIEARPDLVAAAQAHWHTAGHNACLFAAYMSAQRDDHGWVSLVVDGERSSAHEEAAAIAKITAPLIEAAETEVVSVLTPHRHTADQVADLVWALGHQDGWSLTDEGSEEDVEHGSVTLTGLRVDVDLGYLGEVLGFGPIATFGATRRAPFTELALRVKPPTKRPRDRRAFMAHYNIPDLDKQETGVWWAQTTANRAARLGPDYDSRAKASVTVALPAAAWDGASSR